MTAQAQATRPIRIAVLDDHPAVRVGLDSEIGHAADLAVVGAAANEDELWECLDDAHPDVVVIDLHHPGRDGLRLCQRLRDRRPAPAVILYSARLDDALIVAASLAGAGAVVSKACPTEALLDAVRVLAHAPETRPRVSLAMLRNVAASLDDEDRAPLVMRLAGTEPDEIARTLGQALPVVHRRLASIVARLHHDGVM